MSWTKVDGGEVRECLEGIPPPWRVEVWRTERHAWAFRVRTPDLTADGYWLRKKSDAKRVAELVFASFPNRWSSAPGGERL